MLRLTLLSTVCLATGLLFSPLSAHAEEASGAALEVIYPPKDDFLKHCKADDKVKAPKKDWSGWNGKGAFASPKEMLDIGRFYLTGNATYPANRRLAREIFTYLSKQKAQPKITSDAKIQLAMMAMEDKLAWADANQVRQWLNAALVHRARLANYHLGHLEENQKQYEKAAEHYKKALDQGDPSAAFALARLYRLGTAKAPTPNAANQLVQVGQNQILTSLGHGDCSALHEFGALYHSSLAVPTNEQAAAAWYEASAATGNTAAMITAANIYRSGNGIEKDIDKATSLLEKAVGLGSGRAAYILGTMYARGEDVKQSEAEAVIWYEKAAQYNYGRAMRALAKMYTDPKSKAYAPEKAFVWLDKAASQPDASPETMIQAGRAYDFGRGTAVDHAKALSLYERAAAAKSGDGFFMLGESSRYGRGVPQDISKSIELYEKGAALGSVEAMAALATSYEKGIGVSPDPQKQKLWLEKAVAKQDETAVVTLAQWLFASTEKKDHARGIALLRRFAEKNYPNAMLELSLQLREGTYAPKDTDEADDWQDKALEAENSTAAYDLAKAYLTGRVKGKDAEDAVALLEDAAKEGEPRAQLRLGELYLEGAPGISAEPETARQYFESCAALYEAECIEKQGELLLGNDKTKPPAAEAAVQAKAFFERAADLGNAEAMRQLGKLYLAGHGIPFDGPKAADWLTRAARLGDLNAATVLSDLYFNGTGVEVNNEKAMEWLHYATERRYAPAMRKLARAYARGVGVKQDPKQYIQWMTKAAELGDVSAMVELGNAYAAGYGETLSNEKAIYWLKKAATLGNHAAAEQLKVLQKKQAE